MPAELCLVCEFRSRVAGEESAQGADRRRSIAEPVLAGRKLQQGVGGERVCWIHSRCIAVGFCCIRKTLLRILCVAEADIGIDVILASAVLGCQAREGAFSICELLCAKMRPPQSVQCILQQIRIGRQGEGLIVDDNGVVEFFILEMRLAEPYQCFGLARISRIALQEILQHNDGFAVLFCFKKAEALTEEGLAQDFLSCVCNGDG